jgi:uncharacterized membrane protein (UPF0136 family)
MRSLGRTLALYGATLVACGLVGNALIEQGSPSALFNGGVFGVVMIILGVLLRQGRQWTLPAALSATAVFTLTFAWRGATHWMAVINGDANHVAVATLLTVLLVLSALMCLQLLRHYRH